MKALYKGNRIDIEIEADSQVELFEELARLQDVFDEKSCGVCKKEDLLFTIRNVKDGKNKELTYHEMKCQDCGAKLAFGIHNNKTGSLFPKRKLKLDSSTKSYRPAKEDDEGPFYYETRGWHKYEPRKQ